MLSRLAKVVGFVGGVAAVVWAMRDRFISVAVSREPEPPAFRKTPRPSSESGGAGLEEINGIGPTYAGRLEKAGVTTVSQLAATDAGEIARIAEVSTDRAEDWLEQAKSM